MQSSAEREEVRVRSRRPAPVPEPEVEDAEEVEDSPRPVRCKSREAIAARPLRQTPPPDADEEDEEESLPQPRPRRFKRRQRKKPKSRLPGGWGFVRWIAAAVVYIIVGTTIAVHMVITGHTEELIIDAIEWVIMMPISLIIMMPISLIMMMPISLIMFVISMFVGSAIAGGIDFGDAKTAIPKAIFMLAPINLFYVLLNWYIASFLSLPFWIFGLILLFGLDVWESWFMIVINWFLNIGANILLILIIVSMMHGMASKEDEGAFPDNFGNGQFEAPVQKPPSKMRKELNR
jgi:hypothetical protein